MRSSARHPRLDVAGLPPPQKKNPRKSGGVFETICTAISQRRCDSSAACRLCRLELQCIPTLGYCTTSYKRKYHCKERNRQAIDDRHLLHGQNFQRNASSPERFSVKPLIKSLQHTRLWTWTEHMSLS